MAKVRVKKKKRVSNIVLVVVCIMITLYTAASFVLQYFTSTEISPDLTNAWFAFWGTELIALTGIKISKIIKGSVKNDFDDLDDLDTSDWADEVPCEDIEE